MTPPTQDAAPGGVDLHCHSTASDGSLAPAEVVRMAAAAGVRLLALTDHDTLDGVASAQAAGLPLGVRVVPAIELSVRWGQRPLHLVGLDVDPQAPALLAGIARLQAQRLERAAAIATKLQRLGLQEALPRATALAGGGQITRTHFARLLVADGLSRDLARAFKQLLAAGRPGYVAADWVPMEQAVNWIRQAGGQAVLAHPLQYRLGSTLRERLLEAFKAVGGNALEVCCGNSDAADIAALATAAQRHGLMGSIGSDFHSPQQRWLRLGGVAPLPRGVAPVWSQFRGSS